MVCCQFQLVTLVRDVEHLLVSLAIYVEQARHASLRNCLCHCTFCHTSLTAVAIEIAYRVIVEQARRDELNRVTDQTRSLADDIRLIEEQGIYHLLCSLHLGGAIDSKSEEAVGWLDAAIARGVMLVGCGAFEHQAPVDNRNYMTFYTLDHLLLRIIEQDVRHFG